MLLLMIKQNNTKNFPYVILSKVKDPIGLTFHSVHDFIYSHGVLISYN